MQKKTFLIVSLIFSVLFLLYTTLEYYGVKRRIFLHLSEPYSYLERYKTLNKGSKDKVIIAFSLKGENKDKPLKPFINSILDQTIRVDDIVLNMPYKDSGKVPEYLKNIVSIGNYSKDYQGDDTLICSVLREPEKNTKIIILNPGIIYDVDFIEELVSESDKNPDSIIKKNGATLVKPSFFDEKISDYKGKDCIGKCSNAKVLKL
jgi:hypothetical protein